jgi:glycosyltransferase involved in cell wall biosynthesis
MGRAGIFASRGRAKTVGWYGGYYKLARFQNCDYHVALTDDIAQHIVAQGVDPSRVEIIHTYADIPSEPALPRSTFDTPDDVPLLLALARLHEKKGLDVLLEALVRVPEAYLWIAGAGPLEGELKDLTAKLGLEARVRFLGWRTDRGALLKAADICTFPSRYEPFGTVMVDAWAAGTPLIAAAAQGPKAYVKNEVNGLLIPIDDVTALADAIERLIADDTLRTHIVDGGRTTFESDFSRRAFVERSMTFYRKVIGSG